MQITSNFQTNRIANDSTAAKSAAKTCARPGGGQDQVQISSLASQLASDPLKISQLQASYEAGTYNVSPAQIANSILNDAMR